ncbi:MAG: agmatinase [Vulcanimicrobiota bacterium]
MIFFGAQPPGPNSGCHLYGLPFESPGDCRGGASAGTRSVREASSLLETYVPRYGRDFLDLKVADHGDLDCSSFDQMRASLEQIEPRPIFLGGDHTIAEATVEAVARAHPDLVVLTFDAHLDAFDVYEGDRHAHATWVRRVGEQLGRGRVWVIGIRAYTREEEDYVRHHQRMLPLHEVDLETATRAAVAEIGDRPVYISIDVDVLDPAYAPGVGNPEGLGATNRELWKAIELCAGLNVVAFDVLEVIPRLDTSLRTSVIAAELLRDCSLLWYS